MKRAFFLFLFVMVLNLQNTFATVADPKPVDVKQSDKTTLTLKLFGDERLNWASSLDGYTLLRAENQDYVYAISDKRRGMIPSNVIAHNEGDRSQEELAFLSTISKNLFFSDEQLSLVKQYNEALYDFKQKSFTRKTGVSTQDYKMLVILMSFADREFQTPREEVEALYNQVGYSSNGNAGSVHDYFVASTVNNLNVTASVFGPYTATHNLEYYGKDTVYEWQGYQYPAKDINVRALILEAIYDANNDNVDFTPFTNGNADNEVECVYVIYAGYAQSSGNASYTIWPHRSRLNERIMIDNVSFFNYGCSSELGGYNNEGWGGTGEPLMIGTICHEFSHVLGQPDYYDVSYQNGQHQNESFHPGVWDVMAGGNYNGNGGYPPLWSATERELRGYTEIEEITDAGSYTLPPLDTDNKVFKIINSENEYFVLENRQQRGFDTELPGHGMLIYHVDKSVWNLQGNCVNCEPGHEGYRVVTASQNINATNPFPGTNNKTSFTDNTTPNSKAYDGTNTNKPIYNIVENTSTGNITFVFVNENTYPYIANTQVDFKTDTLNLTAQITQNNNSITQTGVCFSMDNDTPTVNDETVISSVASNSIDVDVSGLNPNTTYYVRAFAKRGNYVGYGEVMKVKTPCEIVNAFPYKLSFEETDEDVSCISQYYSQSTNQWQFVDSIDGQTTQAYDGSRFAYLTTNYLLATHKMQLLLRPFNTTNLSQPALVFAYDQKRVGNRIDYLKVYYKTSLNSDWSLLRTYSAGTTSWTIDTVDLTVKSRNLYIMFEAEVKGAGGVYLDDVQVVEKNVNAFPNVVTSGAENIIDNNAKAKGNLISAGYTSIVKKGFVVSENPMPTVEDMVYYITENSLGNYEVELSELNPSTTYYYRAFASNSALTSYGEQQSFTTLCPRITEFPYQPNLNNEDTLCFINEGIWHANTADNSYVYTSQGSISNNKLITPLLDLSYKSNMKVAFDYKGVGNVKVLIKENIASSWQEIANINSTNNAYQHAEYPIASPINVSEQSFIAFEFDGQANAQLNIKNIVIEAILQIPIITTDSATLPEYNAIKVSATIHYNGLSDITSKGVCYSLSANPTTADNVVLSNSNESNFDITISNLPILTQYYVRAFATNSFGTAYGEIIPISTRYYSINNNIISSDQRVCNEYPAPLSGQTPTGGNGEFSYQWIMSRDLITWEDCDEGVFNDRPTYQPRPAALSGTYYYARVVTSGLTIDTSNYVTILIDVPTRGGNIFTNTNSIPMNQAISLQLRAYTGSILYWQVRKPSLFFTEWDTIENSEDSPTISYVPTSEGEYTFKAMVQNGVCDMEESSQKVIQVTYSVGIDEVKNNEDNLYLAPNPSNGNINITSSKQENVNMTITNLKGEKVYTQKTILYEGNNRLNLSFLETGTYIIRLQGENIDWQTKLIITSK